MQINQEQEKKISSQWSNIKRDSLIWLATPKLRWE